MIICELLLENKLMGSTDPYKEPNLWVGERGGTCYFP